MSGHPAGPPHDLSISEDGATDTGAQSQHHGILPAPRSSPLVFSDKGHPCVIVGGNQTGSRNNRSDNFTQPASFQIIQFSRKRKHFRRMGVNDAFAAYAYTSDGHFTEAEMARECLDGFLESGQCPGRGAR